ncbi:ATP-binding protein [Chakrabartia godavariana]|nr:ATP-binding protein [Chakrabartia godavariana]
MTRKADPIDHALKVADLSHAAFAKWLKANGKRLATLAFDWAFWRRPDQAEPAGDWRCWLLLAGRGFGKTRTGAEWVRARAEADGRLRIALVAATMADARAIMVEGESGLLSIAPDATRPIFEPSLQRLVWPNGAIAKLYSAAEPEGLRGPEHHIAWADECAKWDNASTVWDNLAMSLRLGSQPQVVATTTPRPVPLIRRLLSEAGVATTRGRMADNALNLAAPFVAAMRTVYAGTRLGRQELDGELIDDVEGALWTRAMIEAARTAALPGLVRVVIGVDPPAGTKGDACGIVAVGLGADGTAYVLDDASLSGASPEGWARQVAESAAAHGADRVIAEANNGGDMVASVLRGAAPGLPVRLVHAARGKTARAEPVAALYERGKVRHADRFPALEDELCGLCTGGAYHGPGQSPDRADALVWAVTEMMLKQSGPQPRIRVL